MFEGIIALLLSAYCFMRFFKTRKITTLMLGFILLSLQLSGWPFFLPGSANACGIAVTAAGFCFYDFYKKRDKQTMVYALILSYFAILNGMQAFATSLKLFIAKG